jgi:hypothetical protein
MNVCVKKLRHIVELHRQRMLSVPNSRDWRIDIDNQGCDAFYDKENNKMRNFATSFCLGGKMQIIELKHEQRLLEKLINKGIFYRLIYTFFD